MNNISVMQRDIWLAERRTAAGVKRRVPLFVFVAESDNRYVALPDHGFRTDAIHFR